MTNAAGNPLTDTQNAENKTLNMGLVNIQGGHDEKSKCENVYMHK